jgi:hypothetical protein
MAGLALGMAAGIRYQNVVFGAALGVSLLLVSQHRVRHGLSYAAGMAGPMVATSLMNAARLGSYNPISKGSHYLKSSVGGAKLNPVVDVLATLWVRIVDYSAHPPFIAEHGHAALPKDPTTGVFLVVGGLKKSLLQSAPWIIVALVAIFLVWTARGTSQLSLGTKKQRLLRALSIPILVVLALFAWAGLERHDGWSFNQRYLLELVPLFAVATAVLVDRATDEWQATVIGGAIGVAIAAVPVVSVVPEHWFRQRALMYVPLALAVTIAVVWLGAKRNAAARRLRLPLLALCVGWAFVVHVGDDMWATRGLRDWNGFQRENIAEHLPPEGPVALIAIPPQKEALCPIQLDRDLLIVDPNIDRGEDVDALTTALLATNRRVFVVGGVPEVYLASIFRGGRRHRMVSTRPLLFAEVLTTRAVPPP